MRQIEAWAESVKLTFTPTGQAEFAILSIAVVIVPPAFFVATLFVWPPAIAASFAQ